MFEIKKDLENLLNFFSIDILINVVLFLIFLIGLIIYKLKYISIFIIFNVLIFCIYLFFVQKFFSIKKISNNAKFKEINRLIYFSNLKKFFILIFRYFFSFVSICEGFYLYKTKNISNLFLLVLLYIFCFILFYFEVTFFDIILIKDISFILLSKNIMVLDFYEKLEGGYLLKLFDVDANEQEIFLPIFNYYLKFDNLDL